jgi:hypothetical protein
MKQLEAMISELEIKIEDQERINEQVSKASVGWHIEHSLLTLNQIIDALGKSDPAHYRQRFDIRRVVFMVLGKIPRGRIKAPRAVRPTEGYTSDTLKQHVSLTRTKLNTLEHLTDGHYFKHPFLGDFKRKPAIKFMRLHTNHHLKIIKDIIEV